jgi:hypothetical protein
MAIVTLRLPAVKACTENRPGHCPACDCPILQRWGSVEKAVKDPHVHQAVVYRYRCTACQHTFRHYPEGLSAARQSQRMVQFAALCWIWLLGRRVPFERSIVPAHQCLARRVLFAQVWLVCLEARVGRDGFYLKIAGQERPRVVAVDWAQGSRLRWGLSLRDWRCAWLEPLVKACDGGS